MFFPDGYAGWVPRDGGRLVLTGLRVLDFCAAPQHEATVVLEGDRIASVGDETRTRRDDDLVVSLRGKTVMPGMVSCHFHPDYRGLSVGMARPPTLEKRRGVAMANAVAA